MSRPLAGLLVLCFLYPDPIRADISLIGSATLPGNSTDRSGLQGQASDGTPQNQLGGLSGVAYTGVGEEYVHIADRGPKDGASDYICRFHRMTIRVRPGQSPAVVLDLTETTLLTNETGKRFVGSLAALDPIKPSQSLRLDPEGVRLGADGKLFLSDEYGPFLAEFNDKGQRSRVIPIPERFQLKNPAGKPEEELPPRNLQGRIPNRGMEGLAITPDGKKLYGILQSPLIQDGGLDKENQRVGLNCRILEVDLASGKTREFVYPLDSPSNGVNEILAVNNTTFLVLERDSLPGKDARFKKVMWIDLNGATDVSKVEALPATKLPTSITPVQKKPFLDLLAKPFGIAGEGCPEKFEGLAFGPDLPDGRHLLIVTADNDFIPEQPLRVYAFAVEARDLPGFVAQQFKPRR